jgi:hypothetical protein
MKEIKITQKQRDENRIYYQVIDYALKCTSKEKIDTAIKLVNIHLRREYGGLPLVAWIEATSEKENLGQEHQGFENIYRCYHQSFKVASMPEQVIVLIDLLTYLFHPDIPVNFYGDKENLYAFERPFKKVYGDYLVNVDKVFASDSLSYCYAKDILERKPEKSGYVDYENHHLAYMGGVYWALICLTSLLGILKYDVEGKEDDKGYLTYQRGIARYILNDLNWQNINPAFNVTLKFGDLVTARDSYKGKLKKALGKMYLREAKRALKRVIGNREIESIDYCVTESNDVFIPFTLKGYEENFELFMGLVGGGWTLRIRPNGKRYFDTDLSAFERLEEMLEKYRVKRKKKNNETDETYRRVRHPRRCPASAQPLGPRRRA